MFKHDVPDLEDPPVQWMSVYKVGRPTHVPPICYDYSGTIENY
ncbi:hypothetical protein HanRHA438_Chr10g0455791 [Helianthus annuus]|nr:hypothetical protein HanIR_Chr10g0478151 [Helianthus annuus]KAJ0879807.1 hypothetical protein HanRHA438_Chr10g0455791 [Helianthus annuus]